jgi:hypothetical protein
MSKEFDKAKLNNETKRYQLNKSPKIELDEVSEMLFELTIDPITWGIDNEEDAITIKFKPKD